MMLSLFVLLGGCASVFNPYNEEFSCPDTDPGKCVSMKTAYEESVRGVDDSRVEDAKKPEEGKEEAAQDVADRSGAVKYEEALYEELRRLIKEPVTPMVRPPEVVRVLLLPYRGDGNELYMKRYIYFFADEPGWILENVSLPGQKEEQEK